MSEPADLQDHTSLALFTESARKSGVCWLALPDDQGRFRDRLAWHVWYDGGLLVLSGPDEQSLPGLPDSSSVEVALRSGDNGGLLVRRRCQVRAVGPSDPGWDAAAAALLSGRLNHGPVSPTLDRWRRSATFHLLLP